LWWIFQSPLSLSLTDSLHFQFFIPSPLRKTLNSIPHFLFFFFLFSLSLMLIPLLFSFHVPIPNLLSLLHMPIPILLFFYPPRANSNSLSFLFLPCAKYSNKNSPLLACHVVSIFYPIFNSLISFFFKIHLILDYFKYSLIFLLFSLTIKNNFILIKAPTKLKGIFLPGQNRVLTLTKLKHLTLVRQM